MGCILFAVVFLFPLFYCFGVTFKLCLCLLRAETESEEEEEEEEILLLSEEEMNKLGSKMIKAELMGNKVRHLLLFGKYFAGRNMR